ncbi:hypothetical protein [Streptomyces bohaiensis]
MLEIRRVWTGSASPGTAAAREGEAPASALGALLPGGRLRPGTAASAGGDIPLLLALAADAVAADRSAGRTGPVGWAAVGLPFLGALAAGDAGLDLDAGLWVDDPGRRWPQVLTAVLEAVPVVLTGPLPPVPDRVGRRIAALLRRSGSVLLAADRWEGAQLRLRVTAAVWEGVGDGEGLLRGRRATVAVTGRGAADRPRRADLWLPGPDGTVSVAAPAVAPTGITPAAGTAPAGPRPGERRPVAPAASVVPLRAVG